MENKSLDSKLNAMYTCIRASCNAKINLNVGIHQHCTLYSFYTVCHLANEKIIPVINPPGYKPFPHSRFS